MRYQPQQPNHFRTLAAVLLIIGFGFVGYNYFSTKQASATSDPLLSADSSTSASSPFDAVQLNLLKKIESIKLNGSILQDPNFLNLQDWTVDLGHQDAGRINPFVPFAGFKSATTVPAPVKAKR
jgi:hypothetical protein